MTQKIKQGRVDLIGCGPGDPDLMTLRAVRRLAEAEVVVVDRLVPETILAFANPVAERIDVGKTPYQPSISQPEINRILVREALLGRRVARLKGGDPGIFGRVAEELAELKANGIEVDIIPGVTAAHACAAGIGLPVTLRGQVRQFSVLTASTADGDAALDWRALAEPGQAFAIYMGVARAGDMASQLMAAGAATNTAVVIVENGSRDNQRAVATTLTSLKDCIADLDIIGPAVIFVGLDWQSAGLSVPDAVVHYPAVECVSDLQRAPAGTLSAAVVRDCKRPLS
jgi:uroporphyrin-III C-methyltransferase / precorrin-2 dehydrogenase / sirohydrochlorin ferrochelatase